MDALDVNWKAVAAFFKYRALKTSEVQVHCKFFRMIHD